MARVLISGGTGLVGSHLILLLVKNGYEVSVLSRKKSTAKNVKNYQWDPERKWMDDEAIAAADYIIHLAGANIGGKRWSEKRKNKIVASRIDSTHLLVEYLSKVKNNVRAFIVSSAVGYYGNDVVKIFTENDPSSHDFMGNTCRQWEAASDGISKMNIRRVILRSGIVMAKEALILKQSKLALNFFTAPVFGNGKQTISWIHLNDLCRMFLQSMEVESMSGVYNATAPNPVSNFEFIMTLATILHRPALKIHIPELLLKTGLGELSGILLNNINVSSDKILSTGFQFQFPSLESTLKNIYFNENQFSASDIN